MVISARTTVAPDLDSALVAPGFFQAPYPLYQRLQHTLLRELESLPVRFGAPAVKPA